MSDDNIPEVFIIESLALHDIENDHREGDLIARILKMGGRKPEYRYATTREEFLQALNEFSEKNYRYLHLSSHGADDHLLCDFGEVYFTELSNLLRDVPSKIRVFVSACEAVNHENHLLANVLLKNTKCISVIGSAEPINFDDAAMFWSSFYYRAYLVRGEEETKFTRALIIKLLKTLTGVYPVKINYYSSNDGVKIDLDRFTEGKKRSL
jgi:hypothetical protein